MEKPRPGETNSSSEIFSVDAVRDSLVDLHPKLMSLCSDGTSSSFMSTVSDDDLLKIFSEWHFRRRINDKVAQNGFIFETLSQRFVKNIEKTSSLGDLVRETIMFLNQTSNNQKLWRAERCSPDDIGILETDDVIYINKVYESKISLKALQRSTAQRAESMITIRLLVDALNGSDQKIRSREGWRMMVKTMENLFDHCDLPIEMSDDCRYCYILPAEQIYRQNPYEPARFETLNIPLSTEQIENFRIFTISHFSDNFGI